MFAVHNKKVCVGLLLQAGPEGCGKSTVLDYCFSRLPGKVIVACVHCSVQTTADNVIQKLLQVRTHVGQHYA